ncbi:MAG TPA: peroxiredoxin-like family protein [Terriglobales bacterium]|nr:peroxiredoxin-like family protein [Terriglobales bacterium]
MFMRWRGANPEYEAVEGGSLQERLDALKARVHSMIPAATVAVHERAVDELRLSGVAARILPIGATAPAFALPDKDGKIVRSEDLLTRGRLVLKFFRGRWCPYCIAELETYNRLLPEIEAAGAALVAISPQTVRQTFFLADQHELRYPVLSDAGNAVARKFGLVYRLPDDLRAVFQRSFINLLNSNGDSSWELPLPAAYVLDRDGTVLYAAAEADFRRRPDPVAVLAALRA